MRGLVHCLILVLLLTSRATAAPALVPAPPATTAATTGPATQSSGDGADPIIAAVDFRGVTLEQAIDELRATSKANIVVRWRTLEAAGIPRTAPVELRVKSLPLRTLLVLIVEIANGR